MGNAASYANRTGQSTLNANRPDVSSINLRSSAVGNTVQALFDMIVRTPGRTIDAFDNTHPDYSLHLTVGQVWNLVKFMREEWVEPTDLYDLEVMGPAMYVDYSADPDTLVVPQLVITNVGALGDETAGQTLYTATCAACHGADGTAVDIEGRSLGQFMREKPWEGWFKAKFGEPGAMPPGLVTATSDLQDLYAALANATNFPDLP
jgi:cytochrome c553